MMPSISPDSTRVAYTREPPGLTPSDGPGAPRVYILDLKSKQDSPLFKDSQILGYGPLWSPDGKWISSFDGLQDQIRVVSLGDGKQMLLPSVIGSYVSWSRDSNQLAFANQENTVNGLRSVVNIADFTTGEIINLIGQRDDYDYDYRALAWSPTDQKQLVIGMRKSQDDPSDGLWLIDVDVIAGSAIGDEKGMMYQTPRWDPWGRAIVLQQFPLGKAEPLKISLWENGIGQPRVLAEGLAPAWLP
jgi:Tol biopolymer transport system component